MSDPLEEALGLGFPSPTTTLNDAVWEIEFPDRAVSRYPAGVARNLVAQKRIHPDWPARQPGQEQWVTVAALLEELPSGASASLNAQGPARVVSSGEPPIMATSSKTKDEPILASIGQKSLVGLLKGEGLASTWLVLTAVRIYGNGRTVTLGTSSRTRIVADLSKLSSISMEYVSKWTLLATGCVLMGISFLLLISVQNLVLSYFFAPLFFIGSALVVAYFLTRRRFLVLNLSGHTCNFSMSGIPEEEVIAFVESAVAVLGQRISPR